MAGGNCSEGLGDDFFEQILQVPENGSYGRRNMVSGLRGGMPLGLNLEQTGFLRHQQDTTPRFLDNVNVVDVEATINNNHNHHHLRLHDMNHHNNTTSSPPSSTPGITVCIIHSYDYSITSYILCTLFSPSYIIIVN